MTEQKEVVKDIKKEEEKWKEVIGGSGDRWEPKEINEELTGLIISINDGIYGKQFIIQQKDGKEIRTPSHKVLQNRMDELEINTEVKIVYLGEEPPKIRGQQPTKMYKVFVAE